MIIQMEDKFGQEAPSLNTDTASREELAKACIAIHSWWTHCGKLIDAQDRMLADCGLRSDSELEITDKEKAIAWFKHAMAWADLDDEAADT